jgi:rod shape-determining protein MreC
VTDRRILALRTALLWLLLELVAAAQVRTPDGALVIESWARSALSPLVWAGETIGSVVHDAATGITGAARLAVVNRRLQLELETARAANRVLAEDAAARAELVGLVELLPELAGRAVPARTTYRNLDRGRLIVVLDAGRTVPPDTPALAAGGVIGRVVRCDRHRCWIELITHPTAAVAVRSSDGRIDGMAIGGEPGELVIEFVPRNAPLLRGDELVTSGADGIYPPGLPVGRVSSVRERAGAFLEVRAEPAAAVATARAVVLLDGWRPPGGGPELGP